MHEYEKCAQPHLCYYSSICTKWRIDGKCELDNHRVSYNHAEPIDFKAHDEDKETPFARQQAWIYESYGVSDGEDKQ